MIVYYFSNTIAKIFSLSLTARSSYWRTFCLVGMFIATLVIVSISASGINLVWSQLRWQCPAYNELFSIFIHYLVYFTWQIAQGSVYLFMLGGKRNSPVTMRSLTPRLVSPSVKEPVLRTRLILFGSEGVTNIPTNLFIKDHQWVLMAEWNRVNWGGHPASLHQRRQWCQGDGWWDGEETRGKYPPVMGGHSPRGL